MSDPLSLPKNKAYLANLIRRKKSFLCVGLDPDLEKIPRSYLDGNEPFYTFCSDVVQSTADFAIAYKINIAFFEALGPEGWVQLEKIVSEIPKDLLLIADAKRADIGNTSKKYADYYFDRLKADAITLHPYMGLDSLLPFLERRDKWSVILALTSNPGAVDFELKTLEGGQPLYEEVINKFFRSEYSDQLMFVVGATKSENMSHVRSISPDSFFLVPGVGEQGGSLEDTIRLGRNQDEGLIINVGRSIMYPKGIHTTMDDVRQAARNFQEQMAKWF